MSDYLDTSVIVSAVADEPASPRVRRWLGEAEAGGLHVSWWSLTEFTSALSLKVRIGRFSLEQRAEASAAWQKLRETSLSMLPVTPAHFETAARFADHHELGLRAGDALHLAVASASGHRLVTLDATLAKAAPALGVSVLVP